MGSKPLIGAFNHNSQVNPAGYGSTYETKSEARFKGYFLDNLVGNDLYSTLKQLNDVGYNMEWSFRFFVEEGGFETRKNEEVYSIRKARVTHVAPVESGAGINTGTIEMKSCGPECQANKAVATAQQKDQGNIGGDSQSSAHQPEQTGIDYEKMAAAVAAAISPLLNAALGAKSISTDGEKGTLFLANGAGRIDIDTSTAGRTIISDFPSSRWHEPN